MQISSSDREPAPRGQSEGQRPADEATDVPLARAVLYSALAAGLRPPAEETIERFGSPAARETLRSAADALGDPALAAELSRMPELPPLAELVRQFTGLFGHTARGEVPPYETEYGEEEIFQQSQELADLAAFFRAFGVTIRPESGQRIDHVTCECEFLALLSTKEAFALEHGDDDMLQGTREARRAFLRDHMGRFGRAFGGRLSRAAGGSLYGALGAILERLLVLDCAREGVAAGPETLRLRPVDALEVPTACGDCSIASPSAARIPG